MYYIEYQWGGFESFWWSEIRKMWRFFVPPTPLGALSDGNDKLVIHLAYIWLLNTCRALAFKKKILQSWSDNIKFQTGWKYRNNVTVYKSLPVWFFLKSVLPLISVFFHRLVGSFGWASAAAHLKYQIIGCVAFWEAFSILFSGWLAVLTALVPASCLPTLMGNVSKWTI